MIMYKNYERELFILRKKRAIALTLMLIENLCKLWLNQPAMNPTEQLLYNIFSLMKKEPQ